MARFTVTGINSRGELNTINLLANNREDAHREAIQSAGGAGLQIIEIRSARANRGGLRGWWRSRIALHRNRFDLSLFVYELMTLVRAGLSLPEALETLDERSREKQHGSSTESVTQHLPGELVRQMQQGKSFSKALSAHPAFFPALLIAMIAASEQTGDLTQALERYLQYHGQVNVVKQKVISASLYPALLMSTGIAVACFLICFLAPRFAHVYEGTAHGELPILSQWLIGFGLLVSDHFAEALFCLLATSLAITTIVSRHSVQQSCLAAMCRIRWIGGMLKLIQLARFYRSLGMLLQGGVALMPSLGMARDLLPGALQISLTRSMASIGHGKSMSESLFQQGLMTPVALRLLRAGERNGQIAAMLEQSALFHEREITQWVERFARLVEPVLMLVMGTGIGLIVVLLYLPIFDLAGSLQ